MQRVNYAFFQPDAKGNIFGTDRWGDPQLLFGPYSSKLGGGVQKCSYDGPHEVNCAYHEHNTGLIYRAHKAGAEVYPSIGKSLSDVSNASKVFVCIQVKKLIDNSNW